MDSTESRLVKVFETVFPDVPRERIQSASQENVGAWDSVAAITLMNVIEEEFEIQLDFDKAAELTSFGEILSYLDCAQKHSYT
jgi:acyl carrier protein